MMPRGSDPTPNFPTLSFVLDVNWLRECAPGFPIGVRSVRAWSRTELQRALTGTSAIEWLRGLFAESCSARWSETAEAVGARPSQMDDLALHFRGLSVSEEDALWRASATEERLGAVRMWVRALGNEAGAVEREIEERGAGFWRSAEGEWLREAAPMAAARGSAVERLAALLTRSDLAQVLVRLHEREAREWEAGAGEEVSRRVSTRQAWGPAPRGLAGACAESLHGRSGEVADELAGPLPCGRGSETDGVAGPLPCGRGSETDGVAGPLPRGRGSVTEGVTGPLPCGRGSETDGVAGPLPCGRGSETKGAVTRERYGHRSPGGELVRRAGIGAVPRRLSDGAGGPSTGLCGVSTRQETGAPARWYRHRLAECGGPAANGWLGRLSDRIWERAWGVVESGRRDASEVAGLGAGDWGSPDTAGAGPRGGELAVVRVTLPVMDKRAWAMARESLDEAELVETAQGHLEVRRSRVEERRRPRVRGNRSLRDSCGRSLSERRMSGEAMPSDLGPRGVGGNVEHGTGGGRVPRESGKPGGASVSNMGAESAGGICEDGDTRDGVPRESGTRGDGTLGERGSSCAWQPDVSEVSRRGIRCEEEGTEDGSAQETGGAAAERGWNPLRAALERALGASMGRRNEEPRDDVARLECEQRVPPSRIRTLWARLCKAYGLGLPNTGAALTLSVPLVWAEEWAQVPLQRDARYFERFHVLSLALQEMGRHWLPAVALRDGACFEDLAAAQAMLVYAASEPSAERRTASYGYEAMSPRAVERCALTAAKRLPELLDGVHAELLSAGATELAQEYVPERARLIIGIVARQHKGLAVLLAADAIHLEQCFHMVDAARETTRWERRNPARAMRKLMQAAERMAQARQRAGRRLAGGSELGEVYLIEATRVIANGQQAGAFEARLVVESERVRGAMAA